MSAGQQVGQRHKAEFECGKREREREKRRKSIKLNSDSGLIVHLCASNKLCGQE